MYHDWLIMLCMNNPHCLFLSLSISQPQENLSVRHMWSWLLLYSSIFSSFSSSLHRCVWVAVFMGTATVVQMAPKDPVLIKSNVIQGFYFLCGCHKTLHWQCRQWEQWSTFHVFSTCSWVCLSLLIVSCLPSRPSLHRCDKKNIYIHIFFI